jgi:type VI secretion system protein ImpF
MAKRDTEGVVTLSVLDRLIDQDPKVSTEAPPTRAQAMREMKAALKRDIEWLLNTRQYAEPLEEGARELLQSLVNYGLPDICSLSTHSAGDHRKLLRMMESALATYEPRLENIKVRLEPVAPNSRMLKFVIDAFLRVDPAPEHVSFDTVLELTSGEYQVKGDARAG